LRNAAEVLDAAFGIPGTRLRFGVDALLGLVPGLGDAVGFGLASAIVWQAARMGASKRILLRMLYNAGIDALLGAVPLVGDVSDVVWKANLKNVGLLERQMVDPAGTTRASGWLLAVVGLTLLTLTVGSLAMGVWLISLLLRWIG
jgi:hypothetical protein